MAALLVDIEQAGAFVKAEEKVKVQLVTTPDPTVIIPVKSFPDTLGEVPHEEMTGVPPQLALVPCVKKEVGAVEFTAGVVCASTTPVSNNQINKTFSILLLLHQCCRRPSRQLPMFLR